MVTKPLEVLKQLEERLGHAHGVQHLGGGLAEGGQGLLAFLLQPGHFAQGLAQGVEADDFLDVLGRGFQDVQGPLEADAVLGEQFQLLRNFFQGSFFGDLGRENRFGNLWPMYFKGRAKL